MLFHSGHRNLLFDLPAGFWLNTLSFPELQFWWDLSLHTFNKREEGEHPGNTLIAKALDLGAARNLLVAPPLPFFSHGGRCLCQPLSEAN